MAVDDEQNERNWPKISIVTPSLNQAAFVERTIRSVLNQNYPNLEYIIIDGGSIDGSVDIISRYADRLAYWVSEKDNGQSHAINKGFRRATGDVVAWLNSDDEYCPGALETVAKAFMADQGINFVFGNRITIDENGRFLRDDRHTRFWYPALVALMGVLSQPASFWKRSLLESYGYLDESLRFAMDYEFFCRIGRHIRAKHIRKHLAKFRRHSSSKTCTIMNVAWNECLPIRQKYLREVSRGLPDWLFVFMMQVYRAFWYTVQGDGLYVAKGFVRRLIPKGLRTSWL